MAYSYTFTVFTPTYNRASTLPRVYESLKAQTFRDFEWLIVDDGSTDNTRGVVACWQSEADFQIRYIYQRNQGKPAAYNRGVQEARGELFLFVDSDDAACPRALERLKYHWESIPAAQRNNFSAVTALCQDQHGRFLGKKFPEDVLDSDSVEMYMRYRTGGEKWGFQRTDVLREFPFPQLADAKFVPESVVWLALSRKYKTRFVNEVLYIYYLKDGGNDHMSELTSPGVLWGRAFFHQQVLNEYSDWMNRTPLTLYRSAINFSRYSFGLGNGPVSQFKGLKNARAKALLGGSLPLGFLMYLKDRRELRNAEIA